MTTARRVPITISLFTVTLAVSLTLAAAIIAYMHFKTRQAALVTGRELMQRSAQVVKLEADALIAPVAAIATNSRDWLDVAARPAASGHPSRKRMLSFLRAQPQIASLYIAHKDGSNYLVGTLRTRPPERLKSMGAPEGATHFEQIFLRGDREKAIRINRFLDEFGETLLTKTVRGVSYDPRSRPWYRKARKTNETVRTDVYEFAGSGRPGLTISRRHADGVVGVDLVLDDLADFLESAPQAKDGLLAVLGSDGELIARSDDDGAGFSTYGLAGETALIRLKEIIRSGAGKDTSSVDVDGRTWITHVSPIKLGAGNAENLAIAVPLASVIAPISEASRGTILMTVLMALAAIPLIWLVSRSMSRPLRKLSAETRQIRDFELDEPFVRSSFVEEIFQLETAMEQMRSALRIFALYVPKALVRRMIAQGSEPELGGARRDVTVLFLDLENFTAMSSHLEPEEVMRRMSAYFEVVTQTLLAHGATIDKYIGDAVMAFWNAPNDTADHPAKACAAALEVIEVTRTVTDSWSDEGAVRLRTRIGMHCGVAIIGNVGSSDRMNYTALGSTVNLAARLEAQNRELGTSILISQDMANRLGGRFELAAAGQVSLKGFKTPVDVLEVRARAAE